MRLDPRLISIAWLAAQLVCASGVFAVDLHARLDQLNQREQQLIEKLEGLRQRERDVQEKLDEIRVVKQSILDKLQAQKPGTLAATPVPTP